jgi:hypothetical protein
MKTNEELTPYGEMVSAEGIESSTGTRAAVRAQCEGVADNITAVDEREGCLAIRGATIGPPETESIRSR